MAVYILPSVAKALLGLFCNSNCFHLCPHIRLNSSSNVYIVEWLVSMTAARVFVGFALTLPFGLASRDYTFDRSSFFSKRLGFRFSLHLGSMFKFPLRV